MYEYINTCCCRSSRTQTCKIQVPTLFWAELPLDSIFGSTFMRPVGFWSITWPVYILVWWPAIFACLLLLPQKSEGKHVVLPFDLWLSSVRLPHCIVVLGMGFGKGQGMHLHITYSLTRFAGLKLWQFKTRLLTVPINWSTSSANFSPINIMGSMELKI